MTGLAVALVGLVLSPLAYAAAPKDSGDVRAQVQQRVDELQDELREVELAMIDSDDAAELESLNARRATIIDELAVREDELTRLEQAEQPVSGDIVDSAAGREAARQGAESDAGLPRVIVVAVAGAFGIGVVALLVGHSPSGLRLPRLPRPSRPLGDVAHGLVPRRSRSSLRHPRRRPSRRRSRVPASLALVLLASAAVGIGVVFAPIPTVAAVALFCAVAVMQPR